MRADALLWRGDGELRPPAYFGDVGHDLVVLERVVLHPGEFQDLDCGIEIALPPGTWGLITGRSSTFRRKRIHVVTGVIDGGYRGGLAVGAWNAGRNRVVVEAGERLAQLIVIDAVRPRLQRVVQLPPSTRGDKAFGSTGE